MIKIMILMGIGSSKPFNWVSLFDSSACFQELDGRVTSTIAKMLMPVRIIWYGGHLIALPVHYLAIDDQLYTSTLKPQNDAQLRRCLGSLLKAKVSNRSLNRDSGNFPHQTWRAKSVSWKISWGCQNLVRPFLSNPMSMSKGKLKIGIRTSSKHCVSASH